MTVAVLFMKPALVTIPVRAMGGILSKNLRGRKVNRVGGEETVRDLSVLVRDTREVSQSNCVTLCDVL